MNENKSKSKPRRAQGGKGLLSHQISVQKSHQSIPLSPREEREGEEKERQEEGAGARRRWWRGAGLSGTKREERGEGVFKVPTQGSKIPLDSN